MLHHYHINRLQEKKGSLIFSGRLSAQSQCPDLGVFVLLLCALKRSSLSAEWLCDCILDAIKRLLLLPQHRRTVPTVSSVALSVSVCLSVYVLQAEDCYFRDVRARNWKCFPFPKGYTFHVSLLTAMAGGRELGLGHQWKLGKLCQ